MSLIQYGVVNIDRCTVRARRQTVLATNCYLYTKWVLAIQGIYNPYLNAYVLANGVPTSSKLSNPVTFNTTPTSGVASGLGAGPALFAPGSTTVQVKPNFQILNPGVMPAQTDTAIRSYLLQPRRQLIYSLGGQIVLSSPGPGLVSDCANGPTPLECNVTRIEGTKSWFIEFVIEAAINEVPAGSGAFPNSSSNAPNPILQQEWTMTHTVDPDFFTTRYIRGRVVFRRDILQQFNLIPDQFRTWMGHPVPTGFKRQQINVTQLPDGVTLEYTTVDRELKVDLIQFTQPFSNNMPVNFPGTQTPLQNLINGSITRVECQLSQRDTCPGLEQFLLGLAHDVAGVNERVNLQRASNIAHGLTPIQAIAAEGALAAAMTSHLAASALERSIATIPRKSVEVILRAWGKPTTDLSTLLSFVTLGAPTLLNNWVAVQVFNGLGNLTLNQAARNAAIGALQLFRLQGGFTDATSVDYAGRFAEFRTRLNGSVTFNLGSLLTQIIQTNVGVPAQNQAVAVQSRTPMRGTYLGACLAQALRDAGTLPPMPTDPPLIVSNANPPLGSITEQVA